MAGTERTWNPNTGKYDSRTTKTGEDVSRAQDKDKFQNFRAPDTGSTPRFQPPKQKAGEPLGSYMARVREAKSAFEENDVAQSQKKALKDMEEPK